MLPWPPLILLFLGLLGRLYCTRYPRNVGYQPYLPGAEGRFDLPALARYGLRPGHFTMNLLFGVRLPVLFALARKGRRPKEKEEEEGIVRNI